MDNFSLSDRYLAQFLAFLTETSAPVRLCVFFLVWLLLWLPLALPLARVLHWRPDRYPIPPAQKLSLVASLYALAPVVVWGLSRLEGIPLTDYGVVWRGTILASFGSGFGLGVVGLAAMFLVQQRLGWVQLSPQHSQVKPSAQSAVPSAATAATTQPSTEQGAITLVGMLLLTLGIALWIGTIEELVFRGVMFNQLQRDYGSAWAVLIASLIFALLHLVWEGRALVPQLPGLWLMGVVLSIARWADQGQLGLAIGLHTGWIWTIASLDSAQLLHYTGKAPAWLTGLDNKPLAGLVGLLFLLATAGILLTRV